MKAHEAWERVADETYRRAYSMAASACETMTTHELASVAAGGESDTLTDATADMYGALDDLVASRGMARALAPALDLSEAYEESGIGWDTGTPLSRVPVAQLAELVVWEIEHGDTPGDVFFGGREKAERDAARDELERRRAA